MTQPYLLFQLHGPLASWGTIAVGDRRPSFERPSRSAMLGLIAAALGYKRPDPRRHDADTCETLDRKHRTLADSLHMALRLETCGVYLQDFHTVQAPKTSNHATRAIELRVEDDKLNTKLSQRDYYASQFATVCLWKRTGQGPSLAKIAEKLKAPDFTLYLGRKSCPPALPFDPFIDDKAETIKDALDRGSVRFRQRIETMNEKLKEALKKDLKLPRHLYDAQSVRYFWEGDEDSGFEEPPMKVERWDEPASRSRWQFRSRQEYQIIADKTKDHHVSL